MKHWSVTCQFMDHGLSCASFRTMAHHMPAHGLQPIICQLMDHGLTYASLWTMVSHLPAHGP